MFSLLNGLFIEIRSFTVLSTINIDYNGGSQNSSKLRCMSMKSNRFNRLRPRPIPACADAFSSRLHCRSMQLIILFLTSTSLLLARPHPLFADVIWTQNPDGAFDARDSAVGVVHNGKMWLLGGWSNTSGIPERLGDVWSSPNGLDWTMVATNSQTAWTARNLAMGTSLNGEMWIMGGTDGISTMNDIWKSTDGLNWTLTTPVNHWSPRAGAFTVTLNNQVFVMGGGGNFAGTAYNDVWSSTDGVTWNIVTENAPWEPRAFGGSVVFNDRIWVFGGGVYDDSLPFNGNNYNDVWSSSDGLNWTLELAASPWTERRFFSVEVLDDELWLSGGYSEGNLNDVWSSKDGVNWNKREFDSIWSPRHAASLYAFDGKLWSLGGNAGVVDSQIWTLSIVPEPSSILMLSCLLLTFIHMRTRRTE